MFSSSARLTQPKWAKRLFNRTSRLWDCVFVLDAIVWHTFLTCYHTQLARFFSALIIVDGHRQFNIKHNKLIAFSMTTTYQTNTIEPKKQNYFSINIRSRHHYHPSQVNVIHWNCLVLWLIIWIMLLLFAQKTIWSQRFSYKKKSIHRIITTTKKTLSKDSWKKKKNSVVWYLIFIIDSNLLINESRNVVALWL